MLRGMRQESACSNFGPTTETVPVHVAFLRAINVTGRYIKMAALAEHFRALGHEDARTYINSGNVIFSSKARSTDKLGSRLEEGLAPLLGFKSEVFLRTASEVLEVTERASNLRARVPESGEVNVAFLREPLSGAQAEALCALKSTRDDFVMAGPQIYWLCLGRQMESKFSNALLERRLCLRATFRRVSMLQGLAAELRGGA